MSDHVFGDSGKSSSKEDRDGALIGRVDFGGITREVQLDFVPEVEVGEYVIVHVGFALSRLDAEEAAERSSCSERWERWKMKWQVTSDVRDCRLTIGGE